MTDMYFRADYGQLPRSFFEQGRITNPTELMRCDALYRLLYLCGIQDKYNGEKASDWELFSSFCRAYPLAVGHPLVRSISECLETRFSVTMAPREPDCMRLWETMVENLEICPCSVTDVLPSSVGWLCDGVTLPERLPNDLIPVLDGKTLLPVSSVSWEEWSSEIGRTVRLFAQAGCKECVLRLEADFSFCKPNPYTVREALKKRTKSREDLFLLTAQLFRELCSVALEENLVILLETRCSAAAVELLNMVERSVGLPPLFVSAADRWMRDAVIEWMAQPHQNQIVFAIRHSDVPSERAFSCAVEELSGLYPLGRLCLVSGVDLRQTSRMQVYMKACLDSVFEKSFEK